LEVSETPSAIHRRSVPAGNNPGQCAIHYSPQGNCLHTSQVSSHKTIKRGRNEETSATEATFCQLRTANRWKVDETQRNRKAVPDGKGCRERDFGDEKNRAALRGYS